MSADLSETSSENQPMVNDVHYKNTPGFAILHPKKLVWISRDEEVNSSFVLSANELRGIHATPDNNPIQQILIKRIKPPEDEIEQIILRLANHNMAARIDSKKVIVEALKRMTIPEKQPDPAKIRYKAKLLHSKATLSTTYKELVESRILNDSNFWELHVDQTLMKFTQAEPFRLLPSGLTFFVKPKTLESGVSVIEVTPHHISTILRLNPHIRSVHTQYVVSGKVNEQKFWGDYFKRTRNDDGALMRTLCQMEPIMEKRIGERKCTIDKIRFNMFNEDDCRGSSKQTLSQLINTHSNVLLKRTKDKRIPTISSKPQSNHIEIDYDQYLEHLLPTTSMPSVIPTSEVADKIQETRFEGLERDHYAHTYSNDLNSTLEITLGSSEKKMLIGEENSIPNLNGIANVITSSLLILRNFWRCFPITNSTMLERAIGIGKHLRPFKTTKIDSLIVQLDDNEHEINALEHLADLIDNAIRQYSSLKNGVNGGAKMMSRPRNPPNDPLL